MSEKSFANEAEGKSFVNDDDDKSVLTLRIKPKTTE